MSQGESAHGPREPSGAPAHGAGHGAVSAEPDRPRTGLVFLAVLGAVVLLGGMLAGLQMIFNSSVRAGVVQRQLSPASTPLRELRAKELAKLGRYQWVDRQKGVVRIPVERAIELQLADWRTNPAAPAGIVPGGKAGEPQRAQPQTPAGAARGGR